MHLGTGNSVFKFLFGRARKKIKATQFSNVDVVDILLTNMRQIFYNSSKSLPFSDVLPHDFYVHMWRDFVD